jgi:hypothetical protein
MIRLSQPEIDAVSALPRDQRAKHFVKRVVDSQEVWGIQDDGWVLAGTDRGSEVFQVWPFEEYASRCCVDEWASCTPTSIALDAPAFEFEPLGNGMKRKLLLFACALVPLSLVALGFWIAYWAGFTKALQVSVFVDQKQDLSRAKELHMLVAKLESGKVEEVHAHLNAWSAISEEQARNHGGSSQSLWDFIVSMSGLSLLCDYDAARSQDKLRGLDESSGKNTSPVK